MPHYYLLKMAVDLKNLKPIKSFDFQRYDGMETTIDRVETVAGEFNKEPTLQIVVYTSNVAEQGEKELEIREYVSLFKDKQTGEFGYPEGMDTKYQKFLKYFDVNNFEELIGKKCKIVSRLKDGKKYLGIAHG